MDTAVTVALITLVALLMVSLLSLLVTSLVWVYHDAEKRGKPGWVVALLVLLLKWPLSLLLWLAFRPELRAPVKGKMALH